MDKADRNKYMKEWNLKNRERLLPARRKRVQEDPDHVRNSKLKSQYGISLEEYNLMYEKQGGVCAICLKPEKSIDKRTGKIYNLSVDHCHNTSKVRGLLCIKCNTGIGKFDDNTQTLLNAVKYLRGD